jgi:hypothetical protein
MPLQSFLTRLIWLCVGPVVWLAAYLAFERVHDVRQERDQAANRLARSLALALDQELAARIGALSLLAQSPLADDPAR